MNPSPLRKVIESFWSEGRMRERLECGHVIGRKEDRMGPTNAVRRRCFKCALANQPHNRGG